MKQGDICLVRFPFTDLTSTKLRPALVISNSSFNKKDNLLLIGIFGNKGISEYSIELKNDSLHIGKLNKTSFIRLQNTFSLHKNLIVKKVASLRKEVLEEISKNLSLFISVK